MDSVKAQPFIRWVGGKQSILPLLVERFPPDYGGYCEPFVGGGALFFATRPRSATLSDSNPYLMAAYEAIRDHVDLLIDLLAYHRRQHSAAYYARMRIALASRRDGVVAASIFIYLNKMCFRGLYRENKSGLFNSPMGDRNPAAILDEETLRADHEALQGVELMCRDFSRIEPEKGTFYYFDPPYHGTYSQYAAAGFGDERHRELADLCRRIDDAGGYFMLSNSRTDFVRALYAAWSVEAIAAPGWRSRTEIFVRNY